MDTELLSLKWNNHRNTFLGVIKIVRNKASYSDVTLACEGKFYQAHKLVLSVCSDYFAEIFENTPCKNPVIVLKDISSMSLEFLLDYMYLGEVNVKQCDLSTLIKAAECLQIKGLAVPDDDDSPKVNETKRTQLDDRDDPPPKRRKKRRLENSQTSAQTEHSRPMSPMFIECEDDLTKNVKSEPVDKDYIEKCDNLESIEKCDDFISIEKEELDENNSIQYEACSSGVINETSETWQDYSFDDDLINNRSSALPDETNLPAFRKRQGLQQPYKAKASDFLKMHHCTVCKYSSHYSNDVKKHMRTHTGERPFACLICNYRAADQSALAKHARFRHNRQPAVKCRYCSVTTFTPKTLPNHELLCGSSYRHTI